MWHVRTGDLVSGRYRLEAMVGSGGHGVVWSAFDTVLERTVALKRSHSAPGDADRALLRHEAKHAARVHHPNAISVFDAVDDGECWLVLEYLPSTSLDRILATDVTLPPQRVATIGMQIAAALHAAHATGIVHRDVKPGNVLVAEGDLTKLTDFGVAVWRDVTLTSEGKITGTPAYVAPEVANGLPATPASDVFSLGATLFAAVEGVPPFGVGDPDAILARARRGRIAPMRRSGPLAEVLSDILECRMARERPTAEQVRLRLMEVAGDWEPPRAKDVAGSGRSRIWRRASVPAAMAAVVAFAVRKYLAWKED
jgi:eukaryotic-like serine/threonine-protein kinase